jgi:hypothetical protein
MGVPKRQSFPLVLSLTTNEVIPAFGLKSFVCLVVHRGCKATRHHSRSALHKVLHQNKLTLDYTTDWIYLTGKRVYLFTSVFYANIKQRSSLFFAKEKAVCRDEFLPSVRSSIARRPVCL